MPKLGYGGRMKLLCSKVGLSSFMWVQYSVLSIKHTLAIGTIQISGELLRMTSVSPVLNTESG